MTDLGERVGAALWRFGFVALVVVVALPILLALFA